MKRNERGYLPDYIRRDRKTCLTNEWGWDYYRAMNIVWPGRYSRGYKVHTGYNTRHLKNMKAWGYWK